MWRVKQSWGWGHCVALMGTPAALLPSKKHGAHVLSSTLYFNDHILTLVTAWKGFCFFLVAVLFPSFLYSEPAFSHARKLDKYSNCSLIINRLFVS